MWKVYSTDCEMRSEKCMHPRENCFVATMVFKWYPAYSFFLAGAVRKSKFGVVVGGAVGGALLALSIGVIFVYWNCRVKGAKHNDVFVDVAGILPTSLSCKFPEEKKIHIQILCYYQVAWVRILGWTPVPVPVWWV